jgi:hypothetical protein
MFANLNSLVKSQPKPAPKAAAALVGAGKETRHLAETAHPAQPDSDLANSTRQAEASLSRPPPSVDTSTLHPATKAEPPTVTVAGIAPSKEEMERRAAEDQLTFEAQLEGALATLMDIRSTTVAKSGQTAIDAWISPIKLDGKDRDIIQQAHSFCYASIRYWQATWRLRLGLCGAPPKFASAPVRTWHACVVDQAPRVVVLVE